MKTILITGGSRGIGRATALLAGARGWAVAIGYAGNQEAAAETAQAVRDAGGRAATIQGDVSVEADVISIFDAASQEFGPLDGVVINAGIVAPASKLTEMDAERMARVFNVNVFGAYLCAREAARRLGSIARRKRRSHRAALLDGGTAWVPERICRLTPARKARSIR